jgi:hypothetical protein
LVATDGNNLARVVIKARIEGEGRSGLAALRDIAQHIVASARLSPKQRVFWRQPQRDLEKLVQRDYRRALRENVSRSQVLALSSSATKLWPRLNRERLPVPTVADFSKISKRLSLNLSTRECRQRDGMALRGFYVHSIAGLTKDRHKGGLIYLNTAHHPAAVGATFCHEIGHHLALELVQHAEERPVHYFFDAAYSSHLDDPVELIADVLVSFAAYPKATARKMFGSELPAIKDLSGGNLEQLLDYLKTGWGIDFRGLRQPGHHLVYLAGMVHYAKLRSALLTEYQI